MEKKKKIIAKLSLVFFLTAQFYGLSLLSPKMLEAGTLTATKDTLSNSRLSFSALANVGTGSSAPAGTTLITIKTTATIPDHDTNHLFPGDVVKIGTNTQGIGTETIATVPDTTHFNLASGLDAAIADNASIIATQSAIHTVSFTTASAVYNGRVKIRIPSLTSNNNDGRPDQSAFDFNGITATNVTCPAEAGDLDFVAPTASVSGANGCESGYSCFECKFSGTLPATTAKTFIIGDATKKLINPSASLTHAQGTADTYTTIVEVMNANGNVEDSANTKIAIIESVFVSATVDSTLSFSVAAQESSEAHCGKTTSVATTVATVPLGTLAAQTFYDAAQTLTVSTNEPSGYAVTIEEDNQMGIDGGTATEIPDTSCDDGTCTHLIPANWNTATATDSAAYGLGYSLNNISGSDAAFTYADRQVYLAKQIPCTSAAGTCGTQDTAQTIMSNATVVDAKQIDVCYRIDIAGTQKAGYYWNKVMYIATPSF